MAALTANEILKPFYSGEMTGKERYHMIIKKMENSEPFKMDKGGLEMLKFKDESSLRILKSDNPESIHNHFKGSAKPFIFQSDVKGANPFGIRQLEKTAEFGGGGAAGKKLDPHELMTAALCTMSSVPTVETLEDLDALIEEVKKIVIRCLIGKQSG